jgi:hypothetical protein
VTWELAAASRQNGKVTRRASWMWSVVLGSAAAGGGAPLHKPSTVEQCTQVHLQATWLADARPLPGEPDARHAFAEAGGGAGQGASGGFRGPGFLLTVNNDTDRAIEIAQPFPSSVDWYAEGAGGRLLWRASSGGGGALVDALRPGGRLFAATAAADAPRLTIEAHSQLQWAEPVAGHAALEFRPGCQRCNNPGDRGFRAVVAYALQPAPGQAAGALLSCGLRSKPVLMPPLP